MNLLLTFMDLDKLYESSQRLDRAAIIKNIENSGRNYDFEKYSDEQLFRMWKKIQKETAELAAMHDINMEDAVELPTCPECGTRLNDGGTCPICDDGEEHLNEDKFSIGTPFQYTTESGKYVIRIMWTGSKFKAIANDGIHGSNSVIFTNKFAKHNGELYEVDELEWTGKNYRAIGNIKSIGNIVDLYQQFNNKNINKENLEMNFSSVFEELSHLYESDELNTETTGAVAEDGDLEEGIFDNKKKSAAYRNQVREFESEVENILGGSLSDVAFSMTSDLRYTLGAYKQAEEKAANHQTSRDSLNRRYDAQAKVVLKLYQEMIKTFKKPTNFGAPANIISRAASKILGSVAEGNNTPEKIAAYSPKLSQVSKIKTDKKILQDALKDFYKKIVYNLESDYAMLKKKPDRTMFLNESLIVLTEAAENDDEARKVVLECANCGGVYIKAETDLVIEESSDLANTEDTCSYCDEAAGYKIVGVLSPYEESADTDAAEDDTDDAEELEELLDVNVDAKGFGGEGNNVSVLGGRLPAMEGFDDLSTGSFKLDRPIDKKTAKDRYYVVVYTNSTNTGKYKLDSDKWMSRHDAQSLAFSKSVDSDFRYQAVTVSKAEELIGKKLTISDNALAALEKTARAEAGAKEMDLRGNEPYRVTAQEDFSTDMDEGIFGLGKKKSKAKSSGSAGGSKEPSKVTYTIYDENGREQFSHTFTENPGKMGADEQLRHLIKDQYPSIYAKCKNYDTARKWQYQRQSVPKSSFDTNRNYNYYVSELNIR